MPFYTRWTHEVEIKNAEWLEEDDPRAEGEAPGIFALIHFTEEDGMADRWYPVAAMRADGGLGAIVEAVEACNPGIWDLAREKWAAERHPDQEARIGRPDGVTNPHLFDQD